jgi:hypothetical protein
MTSSSKNVENKVYQKSVNMNNILDVIINYKKDIHKITITHNKQLEFFKNVQSSNNIEEINVITAFLLDTANKKYNKQIAKMPKTIEEDLKKIHLYNLKKTYIVDVKSIMKDFSYIKKFHKDEMLELKESYELKINSIIAKYINEIKLTKNSDLFIKINEYLSSELLKTKIEEKVKNVAIKDISVIDVLKTLEKHMKCNLLNFYKSYPNILSIINTEIDNVA